MGYSTQVIQRAMNRLAQAREDRESENRQHLAQAYEQVPRIREIDIELRRTMAQAARAAFLSGSDGTEELDRVRIENLNLQQERAILAMENFEPGFLDDSPICEHCGGLGYVGSAMCECLAELCRQEQRKEIAVLGGKETFSQFRLDYYPEEFDARYGASPRKIMERTLQTCRRYAMDFSEKSGNLLFSGDTGLGKTFLSACIARAAADSGYSVAYESAGNLFGKLERAKFGGDEDARRESAAYTGCDLLIIDDLGTEMPGQFVNAALYSLVNERIMTGKPTIISTNLTVEEMERRYTPQIVSRIRGGYRRVPFVGEDIRILRSKGL